MRIRIAVGFALAFVVSLLTVAPADAAVTTTVKGNGDVVINGDASPNFVEVTLCGGYAQVRVDFGDPMEPIPVVDDMFINLRGGSDNLHVRSGIFEGEGDVPPPPVAGLNAEDIPLECIDGDGFTGSDDHGETPDIPGNLRIQTSSGGDYVDIGGRRGGLSIGKDLILNLASGSNRANLNYLYVGDDVNIRASGGNDYVNLYNYWVHDRLDINLGGGTNETYLGSGANGGNGGPPSGAGRTVVRGSGGFDRVNTGGDLPIDLGHNPQITTGGNEDRLNIHVVGWTGKFRVNTGSGDDGIYMNDCCGGGNGLVQVEEDHEHELERGTLDVNTGSGDDVIDAYIDLLATDKFNGGPGNEDCFSARDEAPVPIVVNFEFVNDPDCPGGL